MRDLLIALVLSILFFTTPVFSANLMWDYDQYHDQTIGFTVYYTDGTEQYNYSFLKEAAEIQESNVAFVDIEDKLNLQYGIDYDFTLTRYNNSGESGHSNTVTWGRGDGYVPPTNHLPEPVSSTPSGIDNMIIQ
jgi:hypothetical protein